MICSASKLDDKVEFITWTLYNNGFPKDFIRYVIRDKISDFSKIKPDSVQRYLVLKYLNILRWLQNFISHKKRPIFKIGLKPPT